MNERGPSTCLARAHQARILGFAVGVGTMLVAGCRESSAEDQSSLRDSYAIHGRIVELRLHTQQVGVLLRKNATTAAFDALLPPGTARAEKLRGGLHVLGTQQRMVRKSLVTLACGLFERGQGVIEHAGILVTPVGSKQPLLLTREFIVRFDPAATDAQIAALLLAHEVEEVRRSRFVDGLRVLAAPAGSDLDALEACRLFQAEPLVKYAEPNFVHQVEYLSHDPNDPLYAHQWHHRNTGQGGGMVDADIDAPEAWDITTGSENVVIAVLEDGFDADHLDLAPNLWSNPSNPDEHGMDFEDDDLTLAGDPSDRAATAHGTAVAGCAAARGDNGLGVVGSCPECRLMLIRRSYTFFEDAEAIHYAWTHGADILTNSWTYPEFHPVPEGVREAIADAASKGRDGKGCVVLFAVRNEQIDVQALGDVAALPEVIAVGAITNTDQKTRVCGFGACLDLLGPTRLNQAPNYTEGTLDVATTDWIGTNAGYNADPALQVVMDPGWQPCQELAATADLADYTLCFGGTSAATPIVAGVAGLVLSADPELTRVQVQRLLQDTADRTEDALAIYSDVDGKSTSNTHGNGRVNAFEAVRVVAAPDQGGQGGQGGRGGVDVFVRDNRLDWGNTEQPSNVLFEPVRRGFIGHWQSPDIRVDAAPWASAPVTGAEFEAFIDEEPAAGSTNRVYVRVRNRGPRAAAEVVVKLLWAPGGTALPALPAGFWEAFPEDPAEAGAWHSLGIAKIESLAYSGASVAGTSADAAAVVGFEYAAPAPDEAPGADAVALLAIVDCAADPVSDAARASRVADAITPADNNVALRNVLLLDPARADDGGWRVSCAVRNPFDEPITARLELMALPGARVRIESSVRTLLGLPSEMEAPASGTPPPGETHRIQVLGIPFQLPAGVEVPVCFSIGSGGGIEIRQWREESGTWKVIGGIALDAQGTR